MNGCPGWPACTSYGLSAHKEASWRVTRGVDCRMLGSRGFLWFLLLNQARTTNLRHPIQDWITTYWENEGEKDHRARRARWVIQNEIQPMLSDVWPELWQPTRKVNAAPNGNAWRDELENSRPILSMCLSMSRDLICDRTFLRTTWHVYGRAHSHSNMSLKSLRTQKHNCNFCLIDFDIRFCTTIRYSKA